MLLTEVGLTPEQLVYHAQVDRRFIARGHKLRANRQMISDYLTATLGVCSRGTKTAREELHELMQANPGMAVYPFRVLRMLRWWRRLVKEADLSEAGPHPDLYPRHPYQPCFFHCYACAALRHQPHLLTLGYRKAANRMEALADALNLPTSGSISARFALAVLGNASPAQYKPLACNVPAETCARVIAAPRLDRLKKALRSGRLPLPPRKHHGNIVPYQGPSSQPSDRHLMPSEEDSFEG